MSARIARWGLSLLLLAVVVGCEQKLSDTGYVGTWSRGNEIVKSTLAIVKEGDSYRVRWTLTSTDGKREVRCQWDGRCQELGEGGELLAEFQLTPSVDAQSGHLFIECRGQTYKPEEGEMYFRDELVLRPRNRLVARTLEDQAQRYDEIRKPKRTFHKVADSVEDPPRVGAG
jgi:hypothetical protein